MKPNELHDYILKWGVAILTALALACLILDAFGQVKRKFNEEFGPTGPAPNQTIAPAKIH